MDEFGKTDRDPDIGGPLEVTTTGAGVDMLDASGEAGVCQSKYNAQRFRLHTGGVRLSSEPIRRFILWSSFICSPRPREN